MSKRCPEEFRRRVLDLVAAGRPVAQVAADLGHGQVEMLMARAAIKGLPGTRRPRPRHETPTAVDLVERMFTRGAPNRSWVTDNHRTSHLRDCIARSCWTRSRGASGGQSIPRRRRRW